MWREEQSIRGRSVMQQIFTASLPNIEVTIEATQQSRKGDCFRDPQQHVPWADELRIAAHEHWHSCPAAGLHGLHVRSKAPARDNERIKIAFHDLTRDAGRVAAREPIGRW